ncbi:BLOC-3 complex member HPS4 [Aplochiton taeniatus]
MVPDTKRCNYFFLYDGSKVTGEGDPTRVGICYFYPEETPLDKQELLCGQLAGVSRCVSELASSPVRLLRLRRSKFAIRMKEEFLWALSCSVDIPDVSVIDFLDQLINLFCFYNGPIRQSYKVNSSETLAVRWAKYLFHLQAGSTDLHQIFSCLSTIDSTHIDPLLLLKAALILQACQRCPLVLAGCILFRGRVVSTQMPPDLTVKVMAQETETYNQEQKPNGFNSSSSSSSASSSSAVTSTAVFLTSVELQCLRSSPVDRTSRFHSTPKEVSRPRKSRLSRTLSDTPSTDTEPCEPSPCSSTPPQNRPSNPDSFASEELVFSPSPSPSSDDPSSLPHFETPEPTLSNGKVCHESEEDGLGESYYHSFISSEGRNVESVGGITGGGLKDDSPRQVDVSHLNGQKEEDRVGEAEMSGACKARGEDSSSVFRKLEPSRDRSGKEDSSEEPGESPLVPMALYQHRVRGLVLALLVEPYFLSDTEAMEEVYHSSLASLNGLEAHLRTTAPGAPGPQGPYIFAHFDCIQNTLTTNLSGQPGGAQERSFVRATSLLHSHFSHTETLQEAIVRRADSAVYGTRSVAQETYFLQQGGTVRNSGIPNHQDSAFSLPSKARHRLLKHGVNLL